MKRKRKKYDDDLNKGIIQNISYFINQTFKQIKIDIALLMQERSSFST